MRQYRGSSGAQRQSDRRAQLIAAAIAVYGEEGHERAGIRRICQAAGLSERYFYESFANREELLAASFDYAAGAFEYQLLSLGAAAPRATLLVTYLETLRAHPVLARVFAVEARLAGGPIVTRFDEAAERFARILCGVPLDRAVGDVRRVLLVGIGGALFQIGRQWIGEGFATPFHTIRAAAERLCAPIDEDIADA